MYSLSKFEKKIQMERYKESSSYYLHSVKHLPIYKKAIEIYALSQNVAAHIAPEKTIIDLYLSSKEIYNELDQLVISSLSIAPKIAIAQSTKDTKLRLKTLDNIAILIERLRSFCKAQNKKKYISKEYLKLLYKELSHLKSMHRHWSISLSQLN